MRRYSYELHRSFIWFTKAHRHMANSHRTKPKLLAFFLARDLPDPAEAERAAEGDLIPGGLLHKLAKRLLPVPVDASTPVKVWSSLDEGASDMNLMRRLLVDHARVVGENFTDRRYYSVRRKPFRNGFLGECTLITILGKHSGRKRTTPPAPPVAPRPASPECDSEVGELDELVRMALEEEAAGGVVSPELPSPEIPVAHERSAAQVEDDATVEDVAEDQDASVRVADEQGVRAGPVPPAVEAPGEEERPAPDPRPRHIFLLFEKSPADSRERQAALKRNRMLPGGQVETILHDRLRVFPPEDCPVTVIINRGARARNTAKVRALVIIAGRRIGREYGDKSLFTVRLRTFRDDQLGKCSLVRVLAAEQPAPALERPAAPVLAEAAAPTPVVETPPAVAVPGGPFLSLVAVFLEGRPAEESELAHFMQHGHPLPGGVIDRLLEENLPVRPEPHVPLVLWPDYGPDAAQPVALRQRVMQTGRRAQLDFEDSRRFAARGKRVFDDEFGRGVIVSMLSRAPMVVDFPPAREDDAFLAGTIIAPEEAAPETLVEEAYPAEKEAVSQDVAVAETPVAEGVTEEPDVAEALEGAVEEATEEAPAVAEIAEEEGIAVEEAPPIEQPLPAIPEAPPVEDIPVLSLWQEPEPVEEIAESVALETPAAIEEMDLGHVATAVEPVVAEEPEAAVAEVPAVEDMPVLSLWREIEPAEQLAEPVAVEETRDTEPSETALAQEIVEEEEPAEGFDAVETVAEAPPAEEIVEEAPVEEEVLPQPPEEGVAVEDLPVLSLWEGPESIVEEAPEETAVEDIWPAQAAEQVMPTQVPEDVIEEGAPPEGGAAVTMEQARPAAPEAPVEPVAVEDLPVLSLWQEMGPPAEEPAAPAIDTWDQTRVPQAPPVSLPESVADVMEPDASTIVLEPVGEVEGPPLVPDVPVLDRWIEEPEAPAPEGIALEEEPAAAAEELLEEETSAGAPPVEEALEEEAAAEAPPPEEMVDEAAVAEEPPLIADLPVLGVWEEPVGDIEDTFGDEETELVAEEVPPSSPADESPDDEADADVAIADLPVLDRWTDQDDRAVAEMLGEESPGAEVVEEQAPPEAQAPLEVEPLEQEAPAEEGALDEEALSVEAEPPFGEDAAPAVMDLVEEPPAVAPRTLDECLDVLAAGVAPLRDVAVSGEAVATEIFEQLDEMLSSLSEHVSWGPIEAASAPSSARALRLVDFDTLSVYRTIGARIIEVRDEGAAGVAVREIPDAPSLTDELRLAGLGLFFACLGAVARSAESEWDTDALDRTADVVCVAIDNVWPVLHGPEENTALAERLSDLLRTLGQALLNFNGNARLIEIAKRRASCPQASVVVDLLAEIHDPKLFEAAVEEHRASGAPDIEILHLLLARNGRKKSYPTLFVRVHAMMAGVCPFDAGTMADALKEIGAVKHDDAPSLVADALDAFGDEIAQDAFRTLARLRTPKAMGFLLTYVGEDDDPKTPAAVAALAAFRDRGLFDAARSAFAEKPRLAILDVIAVAAPRSEVGRIMEWTADFDAPQWRRRVGRTCSRIDLSEILEHAAAIVSSDPNALSDDFLAGMLPEASERIHRRLAPLVFAWGLRLTFSGDPEVVAIARAFLDRLLRDHAVHRLYELCQRRLHTVTDVLKHQRRWFLSGPPEDTPAADAAAWLLSGFLFIRRLSDDATIISLTWKSPNAATLDGLLRILASRSARPVWKLAWRLLFGTRPLLASSQNAPSLLVQVLFKALSFPETSEPAHDSLYWLYPQFPIGAQDAVNAALPTSDALAAYIRKVSLINARAAADYLRNTIYDDAPLALRELHNDLRRFVPVASALEASRDEMQMLLDSLFSEDPQKRVAAVASLDVCAAEGPFTDVLSAWLPRLASADPKLHARVALALANPMKISDDDALDWRLTVLEHIAGTNATLAVMLRLILDASNQQQFHHVLSRLEKCRPDMPWESIINILYGDPVTTLDSLPNFRPELAFAAIFALQKGATFSKRWGSRCREACRHLAGHVVPVVVAAMFDNLYVFPTRDLLEAFLETAAALCDRRRLPDLRDTFLEPDPDFAWIAAADDEALHNATAFASQALVHPAMLPRAARLLEAIAARHEVFLRNSALRDQLLTRSCTVISHPDAPVEHRLACAELLSHIIDPAGESDQTLLRKIAALDALADLRGTQLPHEKLLAELIERWSAR